MENTTDNIAPYYLTQNHSMTGSHIDNKTESIDLMHLSSVKKNDSVITLGLFFTFAFLSNTLALIFLKRSPSDQKRKLFIRLVAGLTFTDLVGYTITAPFVIAVYVNDFRWIGGTAMCKFCGFMIMFSGISSTTIVCIMSIERFLCIRHPFLYYSKLRNKHATVFLFSAWAFAGFIASLPLLGFGEIVFQYPNTWCFIDYYTENLGHRGFNCLFAILVLLALSVTIICNGFVLITLYKTNMRGISHKNRGDSRTYSGFSGRYAECQMTILLIGITIIFSSCYLPLIIRVLMIQIKLLPVNVRTDLLLFRATALNQVLNPWVYILLRREVVWKVASTLKNLLSKQSDDSEINIFRRQNFSASTTFTNDVQYSCCAFCWHCLCEPPQTHRPSSASFNSDYRRNYVYPSPLSSTNKLDMQMLRNIKIPDSNEEQSSFNDRQTQIMSGSKRQASIEADVVTQEPTSVKFYILNGS